MVAHESSTIAFGLFAIRVLARVSFQPLVLSSAPCRDPRLAPKASCFRTRFLLDSIPQNLYLICAPGLSDWRKSCIQLNAAQFSCYQARSVTRSYSYSPFAL